MVDIVRIFEKYALDNNMKFDYGTKASLNLLGGTSDVEIELDKIYFLLERRKGNSRVSNFGSVEGFNYSGYFFLCKNADLDMDYFKKTGESKYTNNIEPLLIAYNNFFNYFGCTEIEIKKLEFQDVTDILDQNMDGLLINYDIYVPNTFKL